LLKPENQQPIMKQILFTLFGIFLFMGVQAKSADSYRVNDAAIEAVFENSIAVNSMEFNPLVNVTAMKSPDVAYNSPQPVVAWLLCWVLGGLAIHRVYMGSEAKLVLLYFITCGGIFGVLPFVDWILLLIGVIEDDISKYVNNNKFVMW
jgi:TM2 domain-containing membrane protein YozV